MLGEALQPELKSQRDKIILATGPLAHSLLGGGFMPQTTFAAVDWRSKNPFFKGESLQRNLAVVERLKQLAAREGM